MILQDSPGSNRSAVEEIGTAQDGANRSEPAVHALVNTRVLSGKSLDAKIHRESNTPSRRRTVRTLKAAVKRMDDFGAVL